MDDCEENLTIVISFKILRKINFRLSSCLMYADFLMSVSSVLCLFQPTRRCWEEVEVSRSLSRLCLCVHWAICSGFVVQMLLSGNQIIFKVLIKEYEMGFVGWGWEVEYTLQVCVSVWVCL